MLLKRLAPVVVLLALVVAACGGKDDPSVDAGAGAAADHNMADVQFAQGMIPHHKQAVEMADMAATKATDPKVKDLAARIKQAQGPEITTMTGWLEGWGEKAVAGGHMGGKMGASGMMTAKEMGDLEAASGTSFDRLFLTMMVKHHEGAIEMARTELDDGKYAPAKDLATQITTAQKAEISEMESLLTTAP